MLKVLKPYFGGSLKKSYPEVEDICASCGEKAVCYDFVSEKMRGTEGSNTQIFSPDTFLCEDCLSVYESLLFSKNIGASLKEVLGLEKVPRISLFPPAGSPRGWEKEEEFIEEWLSSEFPAGLYLYLYSPKRAPSSIYGLQVSLAPSEVLLVNLITSGTTVVVPVERKNIEKAEKDKARVFRSAVFKYLPKT